MKPERRKAAKRSTRKRAGLTPEALAEFDRLLKEKGEAGFLANIMERTVAGSMSLAENRGWLSEYEKRRKAAKEK
jgi:hypothetical protein